MVAALKAKGNLTRSGAMFFGWNPTDPGSSIITSIADEEMLTPLMKQPSDMFVVTGNTNWYAVWVQDADNNNIPDYRQATITYQKGQLNSTVAGLPHNQAVLKNSPVAVTNRGIQVSGYTITGWHTNPLMPIINSLAAETAIKTSAGYYDIGGTLITSSDMTLYAVWIKDSDNDGIADYKDPYPTQNSAGTRSGILAHDHEEGISLRSSEVPSYWNTDFDKPVYDDLVFYTGCTYNIGYDENSNYQDLIRLISDRAFYDKKVTADTEMDFVIEYGGVLTDTCMIGGKNQKPLDTIHITQGFSLDSLIDIYPFTFDSIKTDGQAILKMYFLLPNGEHPDTAYFKIGSVQLSSTNNVSGGKLFEDPENPGEFTKDTLTIKFNIYNKPVFKSEAISQYVDHNGHIYLDQLSGTPAKYMMRSINGRNWEPATSPLTEMEQWAVSNDVSICLREMDPAIAQRIANRERFLSDGFVPNGGAYEAEAASELQAIYADSIWNIAMTNAVDSTAVMDAYIMFTGVFGFYHELAVISALGGLPYYDPMYQDTHLAEYWPTFAQKLADKVIVPSESCREVINLRFERIITPAVQRYVEIHTIEGVTSDPIAETRHYVNAHDDFPFTMTFSDGRPLKVIATGFYSQRPEELEATEMGVGKFSYVIRQLAEPWTVTVSTDPASLVVENEAAHDLHVWTYAGTLYIQTHEAARVNIYTLSGTLFKQFNVSEGRTSVPLERGVYIVEIDDSRYKVVVK
jgi:hypothetical protein